MFLLGVTLETEYVWETWGGVVKWGGRAAGVVAGEPGSTSRASVVWKTSWPSLWTFALSRYKPNEERDARRLSSTA